MFAAALSLTNAGDGFEIRRLQTAAPSDDCPLPGEGICGLIYDPVHCGENSCEYSNECIALLAGFESDDCVKAFDSGTMGPSSSMGMGETGEMIVMDDDAVMDVAAATVAPTEAGGDSEEGTFVEAAATVAPTEAAEAPTMEEEEVEEVMVADPTDAPEDMDMGANATEVEDMEDNMEDIMEEMEDMMDEEELPPLSDADCSPETPCEVCYGDCNSDDDCASGLACFRRPGEDNREVPGCSGRGEEGQDYCWVPQDGYIIVRAQQCNDKEPCVECQGDCDNDDECEGDLACYQSDGDTAIPGCKGKIQSGLDFCYKPTKCGSATCGQDEVCCNESCEICAKPSESCSTEECDVLTSDVAKTLLRKGSPLWR